MSSSHAAAVDTPPEAALVEPLLPPTNASGQEQQRNNQEAVVVSLIPEAESAYSGGNEQSTETGRGGEPELLVVSIDESAWERGEDQDVKFQNPFFAFIFIAQAIAVLVFGIHSIKAYVTHEPKGDDQPENNDDNNGDSNIDHLCASLRQLLFAFLATVASIILLSTALLSYLLRQTGATKRMIEISLMIVPASYFISAIGCLSAGLIPMAGIFFLFTLFGIFYVLSVWKRIPVAAANLAVAMTAVKAYQSSLITLGYTLTLIAASWTCMWLLAIGDIWVRDSTFFWECTSNTASPNADPDCGLTSGGACVGLLLLLSLFWTIQVINNLCHTSVAGVVGSWWFSSASLQDVEAAEQDSLLQESIPSPKKVVYDAWVRSSVYSFGSICCGSLVVGLLQVLQLILRCGRKRNRRNRNTSSSLVLCISQCIVDQLERLAEYLNKWAFVYVGLYGYDYWTAGSKVYNLFKARGWSVVLNDHLVGRYLMLLRVLLSLLSAAICQFWGWLFFIRPLSAAPSAASDKYGQENLLHQEISTAWYAFFSAGFVLGMSLSGVLLRLISSAVDTIVVCFAEAPNQLSVLGRQPTQGQGAILKPALANEMISAWRQVYPQECGF